MSGKMCRCGHDESAHTGSGSQFYDKVKCVGPLDGDGCECKGFVFKYGISADCVIWAAVAIMVAICMLGVTGTIAWWDGRGPRPGYLQIMQ